MASIAEIIVRECDKISNYLMLQRIINSNFTIINRGSMDTSETKLRLLFYKSDPLTYLVRKVLGLSPQKTAITISLILNIPIIVLGFIYDIWVEKDSVGLLNDYAWWVYQIIGVPATLYFFFFCIVSLRIINESCTGGFTRP